MKVSAGLLVLLFSLIFACAKKPYHYQSPENDEASVAHNIVFLTFKIFKDSVSASTRIELIKTIIVAGPIKSSPEYEPSGKYLVLSQLDNNHTLLKTIYQEHPLFKEVEYVANDRSFERKSVTLKEAEFFVRMELHPQTSYIRVEEVIDNNKKPLTEFPFSAKQ